MERTIKDVRVGHYRIPLGLPLVDAEHGEQTHFEILTATVELENGLKGTGYTYTGGFGGRAIRAMIQDDIIPVILGKDAAAVENLTEEMTVRVNYVGRGGISSFAISAVDIALWDLRCRAAGLPLWRMIGGQHKEVNCYYGGIDLGFTQEELLSSLQAQLEAGHRAVKIKVGRKNLEEDLQRVRAVREMIGPERDFMIDANASWDIPTVLKAAPELQRQNIYWLEEPLNPRHFDGYRELNRRCALSVAMGENLHSENQHRLAMQYGRIAYPTPDASNVGGITGWLRVAALAKCFHLPVCTHGMQELHVSLLAAMPHAGYMEIHSFFIDQYTQHPVRVENGIARAPDSPGIGVEFDWEKLDEFQVEKDA